MDVSHERVLYENHLKYRSAVVSLQRNWRLEAGTAERENVFFDEKPFTIQATVNNQKDRVYPKSSADIDDFLRTVFCLQMLCFLMAWAAVYKSWKSPLIFVNKGIKINTDRFINDIFVPSFEEMEKHFEHQLFTFQQNGAPSHTSRKTQDWCQLPFPRFWNKEMWPPTAPVLEATVCSFYHPSVDDLKISLLFESTKIPHESLLALIGSFR